MAKGQQHGNKETRKPKAEKKKQSGPKYLRPPELAAPVKDSHAPRAAEMRRNGATAVYPNPRGAMEAFDYTLPAEMFITQARSMRRSPIGYRRFPNAAEAIRFAVEEVPDKHLAGAILEVGESCFDHRAIHALYERSDYPLKRRSAA